jgi:hypothetical protein
MLKDALLYLSNGEPISVRVTLNCKNGAEKLFSTGWNLRSDTPCRKVVYRYEAYMCPRTY